MRDEKELNRQIAALEQQIHDAKAGIVKSESNLRSAERSLLQVIDQLTRLLDRFDASPEYFKAEFTADVKGEMQALLNDFDADPLFSLRPEWISARRRVRMILGLSQAH